MKQQDILTVLKITANKETRAYRSKLATLFEFLKSVSDQVISASIVETGITISKEGKILQVEKLSVSHKDHLLDKYRYNNPAMLDLTKEQSSLYSQLSRLRDELWKKRKNKDNSKLEKEKADLELEVRELESQKDSLCAVEKQRLAAITFPIEKIRKDMDVMEGSRIAVVIATGTYYFYLPVNNGFYYTTMRMLNIPYEVQHVEKVIEAKCTHRFITLDNIFDLIKKASKFVSVDDLRPSMTGVCLDFNKDGVEVVGTDAHKLYYSKRFDCEGFKENVRVIISPRSFKQLFAHKVDRTRPVHVYIYDNFTATIDGVEVGLIDAKYPDYPCVIPKYDLAMEFNTKDFIKNVKKVWPSANKSTNQVTFHINGSISMSACDIDFHYEASADMPYVSKNIPDTDIAFNGKFLVDGLGIFKDKTIKMMTEGSSTKAAIFTNNDDSLLVMPLMLGDKY